MLICPSCSRLEFPNGIARRGIQNRHTSLRLSCHCGVSETLEKGSFNYLNSSLEILCSPSTAWVQDTHGSQHPGGRWFSSNLLHSDVWVAQPSSCSLTVMLGPAGHAHFYHTPKLAKVLILQLQIAYNHKTYTMIIFGC